MVLLIAADAKSKDLVETGVEGDMTGIVESPVDSIGGGKLRSKVDKAVRAAVDVVVETGLVLDDDKEIFYRAAELRATDFPRAFLGGRFEGLLDLGDGAALRVEDKSCFFQQVVNP